MNMEKDIPVDAVDNDSDSLIETDSVIPETEIPTHDVPLDDTTVAAMENDVSIDLTDDLSNDDNISKGGDSEINANSVVSSDSGEEQTPYWHNSDPDYAWYCIKTFTNREESVKKKIYAETKRHDIQQYVKDIVVPYETILENRKGKVITKSKNFLAGYLLINASLVNVPVKRKLIDIVTDISDAVAFVGSKNSPVALLRHEVDEIFKRITERKEVATIKSSFSKGDPIVVISGPFSGFKGTIFEVFNDKRKVKVEIVILGRKTPVEMNFDQVLFDKPE